MPEILYVLECVKNKYYVGVAQRRNIIKRLRQHRDGKHPNCLWTKKYPALKMITNCIVKYQKQATYETERLMKQKGIRNVRGGEYQSLKLNQDEVQRIRRKFKFKKNACWKCGRTDHVVTNCSETTYYNGEGISDEESYEDTYVYRTYEYIVKEDDNRPTPGMTWHSIPP